MLPEVALFSQNLYINIHTHMLQSLTYFTVQPYLITTSLWSRRRMWSIMRYPLWKVLVKINGHTLTLLSFSSVQGNPTTSSARWTTLKNFFSDYEDIDIIAFGGISLFSWFYCGYFLFAVNLLGELFLQCDILQLAVAWIFWHDWLRPLACRIKI